MWKRDCEERLDIQQNCVSADGGWDLKIDFFPIVTVHVTKSLCRLAQSFILGKAGQLSQQMDRALVTAFAPAVFLWYWPWNYVRCTVILLIYVKILIYPLKCTTGSRLAVSGEWTGWPGLWGFLSLRLLLLSDFIVIMACDSLLRLCVLDGVQTYNTEITLVLETLQSCLSHFTVLGVSGLPIFSWNMLS